MSLPLTLDFARRPSPAAYMLRAWRPSPGLGTPPRVPPLRARWHPCRVDPRALATFLRLTGLSANHGMPVLYPHVFGFPLVMAVLTHGAFPLPVWNALQTRNHLVRRAPVPVDAELALETRVATLRVLEKGAEIDLVTTLCAGNVLAWEGLTTFYYRGRFGSGDAPSPLAASPDVAGAVVARWPMPPGAGWRFARLTGDYNGIHWSRRYARAFGFRDAFHHPQLALGQCLARLPAALAAAPVQRLDAWLKGPVCYGADAQLRAAAADGAAAFALAVAGDERPPIVGRWSTGADAARPLVADVEASR